MTSGSTRTIAAGPSCLCGGHEARSSGGFGIARGAHSAFALSISAVRDLAWCGTHRLSAYRQHWIPSSLRAKNWLANAAKQGATVVRFLLLREAKHLDMIALITFQKP